MNRDKFTLKANNAIDESIRLAGSYGNQEVTPLHLSQAILSDPENIVPEVIKKIGVDNGSIVKKITEEIDKLPKVQGAEQYVGKDFGKVLENSLTAAGQFKDDYVSTEHIMIAIIEQKGDAAKLLASFSVKKDSFLEALMEIRGSAKITDQNPVPNLVTLDEPPITPRLFRAGESPSGSAAAG